MAKDTTKLETGHIWRRITAAARSAANPSSAAVAYFGSNGHKLLPLRAGSSLVVDASIASVSTGLTNPKSLRKLHSNGVSVYSIPLLHAKMFAFDGIAFVGSTNASHNSANVLIEASLSSRSGNVIKSVRDYIDSICTDHLDDGAFDWLEAQYRPPRGKIPSVTVHPNPRLVMQIMASDQQGYSGHQVQPPLGAWDSFFGVNIGDPVLPTLRLRNKLTGDVIDRKVVRHALVMTIDIPESSTGAILEMWRVGPNRYDYRVITPGQRGFATLDRVLHNTANPLWHSGRLWFTA